jgi:hypothetical protein
MELQDASHLKVFHYHIESIIWNRADAARCCGAYGAVNAWIDWM